jgi:hypothetical protein
VLRQLLSFWFELAVGSLSNASWRGRTRQDAELHELSQEQERSAPLDPAHRAQKIDEIAG